MGNPKTFTQASHLLQLAGDKEMSLEQLQLLYNLGLMSDLFEAAATVDLTQVNRDDWKRVLGLGPSVFSVKMSGPETTDDIASFLQANGFAFVNDYITQANFPLAARDGEDVEIEIIDPRSSFSEEDGLRFLAEAKLERPTYQQALRFAFEHGRATSSTKKPLVIFLHEAWQDPYRSRRVLYLSRSPSSRRLCLFCPVYGFDDDCVLAGVRPRKQPSDA